SAASSATSSPKPSARPPAARISAATATALSARRSVTTTSAPSRAMASAPARPIPDPPAVTKATRSFSSIQATPSTRTPAQDQLRGDQDQQRGHQHHRADGVDLGSDAPADRGKDIDRQRGLG